MVGTSAPRRIFSIANHLFLAASALLCILPFVNVLALSFSSKQAASAGLVGLWPVKPTTVAYQYILGNNQFVRAFAVSLIRVLLGLAINLLMIVIAAYPLSRDARRFPARTFYIWYFVVTMLFSGGLIPFFLIVKKVGLIDSIWSLVLPGALPVYSAILVMNFFRSVPRELEESAYIDGAGHLVTLLRIYVPLSTAALATMALFSMVGHWNSWFDGLIFMNRVERYPLQTYLYTSVIISSERLNTLNKSPEEMVLIEQLSDRSIRASQIFVATFPILLVYPFLQRYFTKGIILGSVKG
jgi:putative aldouronate transport system permease protein